MTFANDSIVRKSVIFSKDWTEKMIQDGYDQTSYCLNTVFSKGYEDCEAVYKSIDYMNRTYGGKGYRISGDVIVTGINRVTQKIAKRKIVL